jgi:hypothetical protein
LRSRSGLAGPNRPRRLAARVIFPAGIEPIRNGFVLALFLESILYFQHVLGFVPPKTAKAARTGCPRSAGSSSGEPRRAADLEKQVWACWSTTVPGACPLASFFQPGSFVYSSRRTPETRFPLFFASPELQLPAWRARRLSRCLAGRAPSSLEPRLRPIPRSIENYSVFERWLSRQLFRQAIPLPPELSSRYAVLKPRNLGPQDESTLRLLGTPHSLYDGNLKCKTESTLAMASHLGEFCQPQMRHPFEMATVAR